MHDTPESRLPQTDPKLKDAAAEIDAVLQKYGIAGFYGLASSTHAEFKLTFPQWSLISTEHEHVRFRARSAEPERTEASVHLAFSLRDIAGLMFQNLEAITRLISSQLEVDHSPFSGLWDLDGWQKPKLPPTPAEAMPYAKFKRHKKRKQKGFGGRP